MVRRVRIQEPISNPSSDEEVEPEVEDDAFDHGELEMQEEEELERPVQRRRSERIIQREHRTPRFPPLHTAPLTSTKKRRRKAKAEKDIDPNTNSGRRQLKYKRALDELAKDALETNSTTWSREVKERVERNLEALEDSTEAVEVLLAENAQGLKRKRDREEESEEDVVNKGDFPLESASGGEPPAKRIKTGTYKHTHLPVSLGELRPQPIDLEFPPLSHEEQSDKWWQQKFFDLSELTQKFVTDYFGVHDLNKGDFHQLWALDFTAEFLNYVEQVAEAEPGDSGWDALLKETEQRKALVSAVVMFILQRKVFDEELFGSDEREHELMMSFERALFTRDGFERQNLRSQTVRTILGGGTYTRNFHRDAAKLTAQVTLLLQPLSNYLYALQPEKKKDNPQLLDQYQALYNIVCTAAYLAVTIRASPSIMQFVHVMPGDPYDPDDHTTVDISTYNKSKTRAVTIYDTKRDAWLSAHCGPDIDIGTQAERDGLRAILYQYISQPESDAYQQADAELDALISPAENFIRAKMRNLISQLSDEVPLHPLESSSPPGSPVKVQTLSPAKRAQLQQELDVMRKSQPIPTSRTHRALTKICLWPVIRRYKPGGTLDDKLLKRLEEKDGMRIVPITKAIVVDYFGEEKRARTREDGLTAFVKAKKKRFGTQIVTLGGVPSLTLGALAGMALLMARHPTFRERMYEMMRPLTRGFDGLAELV